MAAWPWPGSSSTRAFGRAPTISRSVLLSLGVLLALMTSRKMVRKLRAGVQPY
jgi:hypothetical protein